MTDLGHHEEQSSKPKKSAPRQSRSCRVCRLRKVKVYCLLEFFFFSSCGFFACIPSERFSNVGVLYAPSLARNRNSVSSMTTRKENHAWVRLFSIRLRLTIMNASVTESSLAMRVVPMAIPQNASTMSAQMTTTRSRLLRQRKFEICGIKSKN